MKTLVLGLGNDMLSDDAIGLKVVRELARVNSRPDVEVQETCLASLELLDLLVGFDRAILVDAVLTETGSVGDIYDLSPESLDIGSTPTSLHHVDLPNVLAMGTGLGLKMPEDVRILAVKADDITTFGGPCCAEVEAAVPRILDLIEARLST
ncbi:MAG TPA: hydrogenase maturation protease [Armatimonadota bacterium]|nr:hydrogenase maturation protease [Armatimonadota bacterium]